MLSCLMTKRRRSPQEKKRLRYRRDFDPDVEYPHSFRKSWPRKKARVTRAHRRTVKQDLEALLGGASLDAVSASVAAHRKFALGKGGARSLRERVEHSLKRRCSTIGWNFFRRGYSSRRDRENFIAFLESLMEGRTTEATLRKDVVRAWLKGPDDSYNAANRGRWLEAFFKDVPEWERKLLDWLDE